MYRDHQPIIAANARKDAEGFKRACVFVLSTIRLSLPTACDATRKYLKTSEREPVAFFGSKLDGLDHIELHGERLWSLCEHLSATLVGRELENALVDVLMAIPGIGLAKAGFIAQLVYGCSGCIDTHNLMRFGMTDREFRHIPAKVKPATRRRHIERYNETVAQCGGTEKLWDDWCSYVANNRFYGSAEEISAMHLVAA